MYVLNTEYKSDEYDHCNDNNRPLVNPYLTVATLLY